MNPDWIKTSDQLPPEDTEVETIREHGKTLFQSLMAIRNGRWFYTDTNLFTVYPPTHWRMQNGN